MLVWYLAALPAPTQQQTSTWRDKLKIVVCAKAVPGFIINPQISETGNRVSYKAGSIIINESDEYALEEAVALKKKFSGEVTVITVGPLSSQKALHTGLAKDADKAVRVDADFVDCRQIAKALAESIQKLECDVILTGVESSDNMAAQVGLLVAEMLGLPSVYAVTKVEAGQNSNTLKVSRELGGGIEQVMEITCPVLLCMQTSATPLSYVALRKMLQSQAKPIQTFAVKDLGIGEEFLKSSPLKIVDVFSPQRTSKADMVTGKPAEAAAVLMKKIREAL